MSQNTSTLQIIPRMWNGHLVKQRADGYVNATQMCQATGKRWDNYRRSPEAVEFLQELSRSLNVSERELVQIQKGGSPELQGTWVHPQVSIHLAQWCSAKFAVQVTEWIFELMTTGSVHIGDRPRLTPEMMAELLREAIPALHAQFMEQLQQGLAGMRSSLIAEMRLHTDPLMEHFATAIRPRSPTESTKRRLQRFVASTYGGRCYSCMTNLVVSKDGHRLRNTEWSRWKGTHRRSISEVWLICSDCGLLYRSNEEARLQRGERLFREFQTRRIEFEHTAGMELHQMEMDFQHVEHDTD